MPDDEYNGRVRSPRFSPCPALLSLRPSRRLVDTGLQPCLYSRFDECCRGQRDAENLLFAIRGLIGYAIIGLGARQPSKKHSRERRNVVSSRTSSSAISPD